MEKRKLIIDCDPGVDDAVMLAFAAAHREKFEILAVTTVSGNQDIEKVTRNALDLTAFYGLSVPVAQGMGTPLVKEPCYAPETHGESGLGSLKLPPSPQKAAEEPAVLFMYRILKELPEGEKLTIAATGPLTNIAVLLKLFPEIKGKIREILFMGGSLCGGNVTAAAEFNFYVDPEAATIVLHSGIPLVMCGLDVGCGGGSVRGAVLGGFRWWRNEEADANVYVLTEADKEKSQTFSTGSYGLRFTHGYMTVSGM